MLVLGAAPLRRILRAYVASCNTARPHQGRHQQVPAAPERCVLGGLLARSVRAVPVLDGLHHPPTSAERSPVGGTGQ